VSFSSIASPRLGAAFCLSSADARAGSFLIAGQDNPSTLCIVGDVPNIFDGDLDNHDGPYAGITMGC
jgi:hypothetical protein